MIRSQVSALSVSPLRRILSTISRAFAVDHGNPLPIRQPARNDDPGEICPPISYASGCRDAQSKKCGTAGRSRIM
jgi:hypothetical protein